LEATLLLCDAAQATDGKLYIIGGGWNLLHLPNVPTNMALAVLLVIDWNETNEPHDVEAVLMTDDGDPVEVLGQPVRLSARVEVGRPAGMKRGTSINAPLTFSVNALPLSAGGYRWEIHAHDEILATATFRVGTGG
jgi:hypothetical protein